MRRGRWTDIVTQVFVIKLNIYDIFDNFSFFILLLLLEWSSIYIIVVTISFLPSIKARFLFHI